MCKLRDRHDAFNLVVLLPVITLNLVNWDRSGWHGRYFLSFWWVTFAYFAVDATLIALFPRCVRSPRVILQHHSVTLAYILVPLIKRQYAWLMGTCLLVEVNTWFLIARRHFKIFNFAFYFTWVLIRLLIYPLLFFVIFFTYRDHSHQVGTRFNLLFFAPLFQSVFIVLNFKWTIDLLRKHTKHL